MSSSIFTTHSLRKPSFMQKLLKQQVEENAVIEVSNLLAQKPIQQISRDDISDIESRYELSLLEQFKLNLEEFYAVYLNYCLADSSLSENELDDLNHLKVILNLNNKSIENIHVNLGQSVYKQTFEEAVSDGKLTKKEEVFLDKLETDLSLPKELANRISAEVRTDFMNNYVQGIVSDQRLSPDEEIDLKAVAKRLNVKLVIDNPTREKLDKLKRYWALENLDLSVVEPDINLQKNELCYLIIPNVKWYEFRSSRYRSILNSSSHRVSKDFFLQSGAYNAPNYSSDQMKLTNTGTLYLTDKRILFTGQMRNSNIKFEKMLSIQPFSDGVQVNKDTGRSPLLHFKDRADVFCIILERLLDEV